MPPIHSCPECFSNVPLSAFLATVFIVLNLLLLCNLNFTSSMILSWLSFGYQKGLQVFYMTPALCFWFIVVSSVFHLFSFLDRSSLISTMPTKFNHCLQAWIHSIPVTPGSLWLLPKKYPLKFHQNHHWMTCCPPQLPHPPPSFFNLFVMAWTHWTNSLHSWFTWLLF